MDIQSIPIETEIANEVWATIKSPGYGHPASTTVAKGHGPCRHCLRPFRIGEEQRTLFTYNPFRGPGMIPSPGPIFIHAEKCARFTTPSGYPSELLPYGAVLEGFDKDQRIAERITVSDGSQEAAILRIFENPLAQYVMVRDAKAGCFDLRVERRG